MSDAAAIRVEQHTITTRDNTLLHANLYRPNNPNDKAIIMGGAMGVQQRYYRHYATYLAEQGFVVLTFDFRGIGASKNGKLWGYDATLLDWGAQDMQAVCAWMIKQYPAHDVFLVAHSISGQLAGLMRHVGRLSGIMGVAAQNIHWRRWQWYAQAPLWLLWYIAMPSVTHAAGFFPSELFGLGERLPKGVAIDWARTARNRAGLVDVYGATEYNFYADFHGHLRLLSFSDDNFAPQKTVDGLAAFYPNAQTIKREHITPQSIEAEKIEHHGFFRPRYKDTLWQHSLDWLQNPRGEAIAEPASV